MFLQISIKSAMSLSNVELIKKLLKNTIATFKKSPVEPHALVEPHSQYSTQTWHKLSLVKGFKPSPLKEKKIVKIYVYLESFFEILDVFSRILFKI